MTVVAADAADIDWVDGPVAGLDPDSDVGFWCMSPASAEQVTVQIRTVLDRAWEFIALAYKGRAFIALGYPNWDAYVDARFGDLRVTVPREHRAQVVAELAGVRMSCRAIAKALGVGVATVHRELSRTSLGDPSPIADGDGVGVVIGRDGKEYPPHTPDRTTGAALLDLRRTPPRTGQRLSVGPVRARTRAASAQRTRPGAELRRGDHLRRAAPARSSPSGTESGERRDPTGDRRRTRRRCFAANGSRDPQRFGRSAGSCPGGGFRARRHGPGHRGRDL